MGTTWLLPEAPGWLYYKDAARPFMFAVFFPARDAIWRWTAQRQVARFRSRQVLCRKRTRHAVRRMSGLRYPEQGRLERSFCAVEGSACYAQRKGRPQGSAAEEKAQEKEGEEEGKKGVSLAAPATRPGIRIFGVVAHAPLGHPETLKISGLRFPGSVY